jgi:hypothetical protein
VMVLTGIFLAGSSAVELGEAILSFRDGLQGEHGAFIYGIMSALKGLGELGEVDEGVLLVSDVKGKQGKTDQTGAEAE